MRQILYLVTVARPQIKDKRKTHYKPVKDTMAYANNLAAAMVLAPVAGVAATVGKFYKMTKTDE